MRYFRMSQQTTFKAGMYLLETLTSGMYNDPLSIYREYIQNAVDSIDSASDKRGKKVQITLVPNEKKIVIYDNGPGIKASKAEEILSGIGISHKAGKGYRGFRGIGRLGGIAFSDKVIFRTKAKGEKVESIQVWDCRKLRKFISSPQNSSLSIQDLFLSSTTFTLSKSSEINKSFFEVTLDKVTSFRNYIFDLKKVREYISQVAPVNFDETNFSHSFQINKFLKTKISDYRYYQISLNDKQIFKPYSDRVKVSKGGFDNLIDIKNFSIMINGKPSAYGWHGIRKNFVGSITKGECLSGVRVRSGNILIGDPNLLNKCFRESRFNSYIVGEIHVVSPELVPNSRRDDFIDNEAKNKFYNEVEKIIGLPISRAIRMNSRNYSSGKTPQNIVNKDQINSTANNEKLILHETIYQQLEYNLYKNNRKIDIRDAFKNCVNCKYLQEILKENCNN